MGRHHAVKKKHSSAKHHQGDKNAERDRFRESVLKFRQRGKPGALMIAQGGVLSPTLKCPSINQKLAAACRDHKESTKQEINRDMGDARRLQRRRTRSERNRSKASLQSYPKSPKTSANCNSFKSHLAMVEKFCKQQESNPSSCIITRNRLTRPLGIFNLGLTSETVTRENVGQVNKGPTGMPSLPHSISSSSKSITSLSNSVQSRNIPLSCHSSASYSRYSPHCSPLQQNTTCKSNFPKAPDIHAVATELLSDLNPRKTFRRNYKEETKGILLKLLEQNAPGTVRFQKTPHSQTPLSSQYLNPLSSEVVRLPHSDSSAPTTSHRHSPSPVATNYMYLDAHSMLKLSDKMIEQSHQRFPTNANSSRRPSAVNSMSSIASSTHDRYPQTMSSSCYDSMDQDDLDLLDIVDRSNTERFPPTQLTGSYQPSRPLSSIPLNNLQTFSSRPKRHDIF